MKLLASLLLLLAACTDFATIERDVCGNGLVETGEDCDSADASCDTCSIVCEAVADCPTTDYVCGVDNRCHAPGGALGAPLSAGAFRADDMRITDINDDGIGDALGVTPTSMLIRSGNESGQLDELTSILTPTQTGPATFGDLDNDGSLDVSITTPDGLVSYASPFGVLAPIPVYEQLLADDSNKPFDIIRMFDLASNVYGAFVVDPTSGLLALFVLDGTAPAGGAEYFTVPCLARLTGPNAIYGTELGPSSISMYRVHKDGEKALDMLFAIQAGTGASRRTCIVSLHRDAPAFFAAHPTLTLDDVTPAGFNPTAPIVIADLDFDGDPCPGLVDSDAGLDTMKFTEGQRVGAQCELVTAAPSDLPALGAPPGARLIARAPVDPTIAFLAPDALITTEGVYPLIVVVGFQPVYRTTRMITELDTGDIDGNGTVDIVFGSEGEEELDLLLRIPDEGGFNLVRLDTASTVTNVIVGDYDGNGIDDIAYTEQGEGHERLMVSYGTTDRPLPPIRMGDFAKVDHVDRVSFSDSVDLIGVAEDLIVFQPAPAGSNIRRVTFMHGNPQRAMLSYFDPRAEAYKAGTLFRGSVIGHFADTSASSTQYTDLIAIAPPAPSLGSQAAGVRAWRVPGTSDGFDATKTEGVGVADVAVCSARDTTTLCLDLARYLAFPTGEQHDVIVGVDRNQHAMMIDPWLPATQVTPTKLAVLSAMIPMKTVPRSIHAADLDGDAAAELIVAMAPALNSDVAGAVLVCAMVDGVPTSCEDLVPAITEAAMTAGIDVSQCYDAAPARLSFRDRDVVADGTSDVIVACRGTSSSLFRVHRGAAGAEVERIAAVSDTVTALRAGDVTGDGIDDLIVLVGDQTQTLTVYPQCTNRDLACLGGDQ